MIHLKNISAVNPKTIEQYQLTRRAGVIWLYSEDGRNWYEAIQDFAADTIKVMYLANGQVAWVGADPAAINPVDASVIELANNTANRRIDASGYWYFRDDEFVFDWQAKSEDERRQRLSVLSQTTTELERDALAGIIPPEGLEKLKQYRLYVRALRDMDFSRITDRKSHDAIVWPQEPDDIRGGNA